MPEYKNMVILRRYKEYGCILNIGLRILKKGQAMEEQNEVKSNVEEQHDPVLLSEDVRPKVQVPYIHLGLIGMLILWLLWHVVTYDESAVRKAHEKQQTEVEDIYKTLEEKGLGYTIKSPK